MRVFLGHLGDQYPVHQLKLVVLGEDAVSTIASYCLSDMRKGGPDTHAGSIAGSVGCIVVIVDMVKSPSVMSWLCWSPGRKKVSGTVAEPEMHQRFRSSVHRRCGIPR